MSSIKERFYNKLAELREDYDHIAKYWKDEYGSLANAKPSRPGDKKIIRGFKQDASDNAKIAVTGVDHRKKRKKYIGEEEQQLDELNMSKKTYVSAMQRTTGYDADYSGEQGRVDSDKLIARAKKYKGKKFADQLAGADQMTERPNRNRVPGQWGADKLAWREPAKATKDGKANKSKLKGLKSSLTPGDYRKPRFPVRNLPEEQQLDELNMSKKTYVSAMQRTTGYDAGSDEGRIDTEKLIARAKKYKGKKFANDLAGADQMTERPNRNKVPGQWGSDKLAWREPAKATKDGKANKSKLKGLKSSLTPGDYRKPRFPKRNLPEEVEQLDELHGKSKEAIAKVKKRLESDHEKEWNETQDERKREKTAGPGNADRNKRRNDIAKRWLRADRAEKKLKK